MEQLSMLSSQPSTATGSFTVSVDQIGEQHWNEVLLRFADASIYQTWAYGAVCWGEKQLSHLLLKRGGEVVAAAQLRLVRLPLLNKGVAYLRWGPLWRLRGQPIEPGVLEEMLGVLRKEYVERRGLLLRMLPDVFQDDTWAGEVCSCLRRHALELETDIRPYHTTRVEVAQPPASLRKGLQSRWRSYLQAAEKAEFTVAQGTTDELYDQFTVLYREMMARKQFETTVDIEEFRQIQKRLPEILKMQIFVCSTQGQPHNALVVSAVGDSAIYLLAATGNAGLNGRGAYLLQWRAMEWLHQQGIRWYDTGGINQEKNPGGYQFKKGLGGQEASHLGRFELRDNWLSAAATTFGERSQNVVAKVRNSMRRVVRPAA
jgi:lipid II:glycine glycyltransferase (peptidoglycan interpeptide bridge formation enzyme)